MAASSAPAKLQCMMGSLLAGADFETWVCKTQQGVACEMTMSLAVKNACKPNQLSGAPWFNQKILWQSLRCKLSSFVALPCRFLVIFLTWDLVTKVFLAVCWSMGWDWLMWKQHSEKTGIKFTHIKKFVTCHQANPSITKEESVNQKPTHKQGHLLQSPASFNFILARFTFLKWISLVRILRHWWRFIVHLCQLSS